jgi:hypothetical protein
MLNNIGYKIMFGRLYNRFRRFFAPDRPDETVWRVSYKENVVIVADTFSTFEDAWDYSQLFPMEVRSIPYNSWRYVAKKDALDTIKKAQRLVVAWVPETDITVTIVPMGFPLRFPNPLM